MRFIHQDIAAAAERYPRRLALIEGDRALTYEEFDKRASALADRLRRLGVRRGMRVAIGLSRGIAAVTAAYGVLKASAAYAPLPQGPPAYLEPLVQDLEPAVLIRAQDDSQLDHLCSRILVVNADGRSSDGPALPSRHPEDRILPSDFAYILFTSGSSGSPKAVCISHRAACHSANWARATFTLSVDDRIAALSPLTFDLSTFEQFAALGAGCTVLVVEEETRMFPASMSGFLQSNRVTVMYAVPSFLMRLAARGSLANRHLNSLRLVLFAGEPFPPAALRRFASLLPRHVQLFNLYGPTETNVCTFHAVRPEDMLADAIPIGQPIDRTHIMCVDENGCPSPNRVGGELCVAGPGVMSGYWRHSDSSIWVKTSDGQRAYRTGDLGVQLPDGTWSFRGRRDRRTKVCGYLVNLDAVEAKLLELPRVEQAAVFLDPADEHGSRLTAQIVVANAEIKPRSEIESILQHCRQLLPHYMIPKRIHVVERFPIQESGKADRRALWRTDRET